MPPYRVRRGHEPRRLAVAPPNGGPPGPKKIDGTNDRTWDSPERNCTLRTDYPGGALPLHSIAACPTFTDGASSGPAARDLPRSHPIHRYLTPTCDVTASVLCAYASTNVIRREHPPAVQDRDCEGETPLHAAASWGNVGACLSLLVGATVAEGSSVAAIAAANASGPGVRAGLLAVRARRGKAFAGPDLAQARCF